MIKMTNSYWCIILFFLLTGAVLQAQTTGKIAGIVLDKESNKPITGANVYLEGLSLGASTDSNGEFYIINVPPGSYTLFVQMIGYSEYKIENLRVSVNRTSAIRAELVPSILEGEVVVVQADRISNKKDQTSSIRNISSDEIELLPVENVASVINLQAGVVNGHFRGGRKSEVSYMVDGIQVIDAFGGENSTITVETESVEDLEVITGTFNAEYGRAMSGIVNAVIKEGSEKFKASLSGSIANYLTGNKDIFIGLEDTELDRWVDLKAQLSGPIWSDKISFFVNTRWQKNRGYLNGINRFNVTDYSDFSQEDPSSWYSENSGDNSYVPMNSSQLFSLMAKLTSRITDRIKLSFLLTKNDEEWGDYNHSFKYNPGGVGKNYREASMYMIQLNHMLSNTIFYDAKISFVDNYYGWYVYENPLDSRYVHESYLNDNGPGFYTGGQQKDHTRRTTKDINAKLDVTYQLNKRHLLKTGILATRHEIDHEWHVIQNAYRTRMEDENFSYFDYEQQKIIYPYFEPQIYPDSSIYTDAYKVRPIEYSFYLQDKMEFDRIVVNIGLRYDYFDPMTTYPSQRRNPANQLDFSENPEKMSRKLSASPKQQISPRLGFSYQLGKTAVLHFSYGHFFQMPPMYALYQNHSQRIAPTDYVTNTGNTELEAQKTVQYEVGLWQQLTETMGLEVIVFYRDIYNLLSTKIISTFNQIEYGLYTNKDYGNVKGLEIKYDFFTGPFMTNVNYTLLYTRGNADNPTQTFNRAGESKDPIPTLIPMSWDQRHTLNVTAGYNSNRWGITATAYYNSGSPFTWSPLSEYRVANINLYPNNAYQRSTYSLDLNGYVNLFKIRNSNLRLIFSVYNVFDRLNENWVDPTTGRAYTAIIKKSDLSSHHSNFNEYEDRIKNPSMYSEPRLIKIGMQVSL